MAVKKSELYSSLWSSCDKYADAPHAPIAVPAGAGFEDMVALKGESDVGDPINKKIIGEPLANADKPTGRVRLV